MGERDAVTPPGRSLHAVPTLADLVDNAEKIAGVTPALASHLLTQCELELSHLMRVRDGLLIRLAVGANDPRHAPRDDVFDDLNEAAHLIGRTAPFIYRNHRTLPFVIQEGRGRRLRFSRAGIARFLEQHRGEIT